METIRRSVVNWRHPDTEMWVQLDDDDPNSLEACWAANLGERIHVDVRPREDTIAAKWNRILTQCPGADVYSVAADDDPYVTEGYDARILQGATRITDGIGMVYGWLANLSFSGSISGTRRWCEILGYLQPEHFPYWFCDHWTHDLVDLTGRKSFADIRTDQSRAGKTQELREPAWWATFYDACYLLRRREARKLLSAMDIPDWQRELQISNAELIDQRSRGVNEGVRQNARNLEGWSGLGVADERYQRVKQNAIAMAHKVLADPEMPEMWRSRFASILFPPMTVPALKQAYA